MLTPAEWQAVRLSLVVSTVAVLVIMPIAILLGRTLARGRFRGKALVEAAVNLPLVLPPVVTGYLLLVLLGDRGLMGEWLHQSFGISIAFTTTGAVVAAAVVSFPLFVRPIRLAMEAIDPRLEGAARSLGAGPIRTFFVISLPLAWRGVLAGAVLAFARGLGEFGATIILAGNIAGRTRTIPLAVYSALQEPGGESTSGRLVVVAVILSFASLAVAEALQSWMSRHD